MGRRRQMMEEKRKNEEEQRRRKKMLERLDQRQKEQRKKQQAAKERKMKAMAKVLENSGNKKTPPSQQPITEAEIGYKDSVAAFLEKLDDLRDKSTFNGAEVEKGEDKQEGGTVSNFMSKLEKY